MTGARARPPGDAPLAFVDDLHEPELDDADRHHLVRVLRLRAGDRLTIADGAGGWRTARFADVVEPAGPLRHEPEPAPAIVIAFAVVKGDRPELVAQKLTELGADRIVPFLADRSVVRWDGDKAARNVERFRRVVREAAMQCRRARLPVVEQLTTFAEVVARDGAALADREGAAPTLAHPLVLVGPEGGWSDEERAAARARVGLSDQVLRAETAAMAACALLVALRSGLVTPTFL
jgi:16S rRNA (uracil1498-N3)-methyltransferase